MRDVFHILKWKDFISNVGVRPTLSAYEAGLVKLTNKSAFIIFVIINVVYIPLSLYYHLTLPVLLVSSFLFPFTFLFNRLHKYLIARHYLLSLLYLMLLVLSFVRGRESGALFLVVPMILLSYIFFYKERSIYIHAVFLSFSLLLVLLYTSNFPPMYPYPVIVVPMVQAIHLLISLVLTTFFISFFFLLNRKYQDELLELNYTQNKLFSIIGHDLRSPLNSIKGLLNLLNNKNLSQEEFYQLIGYLQKNIELLSNTLDNLLYWSLSQMKGIYPSPSILNLQRIVDEQIALLLETANQKKLTILSEITPETVVFADKNHLSLIFRNLLNNAIKFTPENGKIFVKAIPAESGHILISVEDTGTGIEEEQLKNLFTPHKALLAKGTKGETGTGLGLLLCKEMVEINKGKIGVSSTPGKGSAFFFTLPDGGENLSTPTNTKDPGKAPLVAGLL